MNDYRPLDDHADEPAIEERIDMLIPSEEELDEEEHQRFAKWLQVLGGEFL